MSLHFGFTSPRDMLAKAKRDFVRLEEALWLMEDEKAGDALFDFAVAISSLRDWIRAHPSTSFGSSDVDLAAKTQALEVFRDIANGTKHRALRYVPDTVEVLASAQATVCAELSSEPAVSLFTTGPKLKAVTSDGYRHEILQLAKDAIEDWRSFLDHHGV